MKQGYNAYRNAAVDTADQGKLILIAYDVAIKHGRLALEMFDDYKLTEERTKHLFKAQDAINELLSSLNLEAGEIATNLFRLYDYMLRSLMEAGIKSNKEKVSEVLGYLESLRSAWSEASLKVKADNGPALDSVNMAISG